MKIVKVVAATKTKQGNFQITDSLGMDYFMAGKKVSDEKTLIGSWASVRTRTFTNRMENGELKACDPWERSEIAAVFSTKEAAIEAFNAEKTFAVEAAADLEKTIKASSVSQTSLDAIFGHISNPSSVTA